MHPSSQIFAHIQSLWQRGEISDLPAFFSFAASATWQRVKVTDLEKFYQHIRAVSPLATAILTSYSVGTQRMLVAHYESPADTCHRVWSVAENGSLANVYESPIGRIGKAA